MREGFAIVYRPTYAPLFSAAKLYLTDKSPRASSQRPSEAKLFRTWQQAVACRATLNETWQCSAQVVYLTEYDTQRPN